MRLRGAKTFPAFSFAVLLFLWNGADSPALSAKPYKNKAFQIGEELHYTIHWTFFHAGYSSIHVVREFAYGGQPCLLFESKARSTGFLGSLFHVKDHIRSYWDYRSQRSLYSEKNIKEGNYLRKSRVYFRPAKREAKWSLQTYSGNTSKIGVKKKGLIRWKKKSGLAQKLPKRVHDMLAALYYSRAHGQRLRVGGAFYIDVFDDNKLSKLKMELLRKESLRLEVNGEEKRFDAVVIRPHISTAGIFRTKGEVRIWISDDSYRWPLWIKAEAPVLGHIHVKLYRTAGVL